MDCELAKKTSGAALNPAGLVAMAVAHAFALFVGVSMAAYISGGHLNPAVTVVFRRESICWSDDSCHFQLPLSLYHLKI
ncbi:hypothetical protein CsSME_00006268 [Camellia sinensis var. sinensis]